MKFLSEQSVKCLFTGSLWLLLHATAKVISCYRNCTSHKLLSIYSLSFTSMFANFSRKRTYRVRWGKKAEYATQEKCKNVYASSFRSTAREGRSEVRFHVTVKNAVNTRPEDPHKLKIPSKYAFSNYMEWRQTQSKDIPQQQ